MTILRACALQLPFVFAGGPQEFTDRLRGPIERAAAAGAELIVLPDYTGYALFGMLAPELEGTRRLDLTAMARPQHFDSVLALMRARAALIEELFVHVLGSLAERTATWLVPGSCPEFADGQWHNTAYVFSPDGRAVGRQRQTHRSAQERAAEMAVGDDLAVFDAGAGRLGLVLGEDVRYPEVSRILALKGANVLVHPATLEGAGGEHFLRDLWREVQSNQVFGVQANFVAEDCRGRSAIYAPVELSADHRGILAQAADDSEAEAISADLDFAALQKVVDDYPIFDLFNVEFYGRSFPEIYEEK